MPKVSSVLTLKDPKKATVRYDATDDDACVSNIYASKLRLRELVGTGDWPQRITVTIEVA